MASDCRSRCAPPLTWRPLDGILGTQLTEDPILQDPECDVAALGEAFKISRPHVAGEVETVAQDLLKQVPMLRSKVAKLCQAKAQMTSNA